MCSFRATLTIALTRDMWAPYLDMCSEPHSRTCMWVLPGARIYLNLELECLDCGLACRRIAIYTLWWCWLWRWLFTVPRFVCSQRNVDTFMC